MHNKNIKGDYYSYHLFHLFLKCCEAFKQLARAAFVQLSHIYLKEINECLEKTVFMGLTSTKLG